MALRGHRVTAVSSPSSVPIPAVGPCAVSQRALGAEVHMATIGLVSLTERLLNQTAGQAQELQAAAPSRADANARATAPTVDQFTPSAQNAAQAAGLFTVSQFTLFSPAAQFFLAQAPGLQANPSNTPGTAANFTASPAAQEAAATNTAAPVPAPDAGAATVSLGTPAPRSATAANPAAASAAANAPATTSANVQHQLQLLNNALAALGLNSVDIQKIDSIAGVIGDFHPTRFANLAFQLQALAQQAAPQAATNTVATVAVNVPGTNAANAPAAIAGSATELGRH